MSHQHSIESGRSHPLRYPLLAGAISLSLASLFPAPAHAGTINVTAGGCTLIDAITSANTDTTTVTGSCIAGSGDDTIVLQSSSIHPYTVSNNSVHGFNALPSITSVITIQGNGATIKRDSGSVTDFRLFVVEPTGGLTLDDVTLSGGVASANSLGSMGVAILN
jgi:hypothetical protein